MQTTKVCGDYPPLFLGCATFSGIYSADEAFKSDLPLRVTRLALRYGINAFDTSPSYHPSEIILGKALQALRPEFPRESYKIITKAGKYGGEHADHMLTADGDLTRRCVERSLKRFNTTYLDTVCESPQLQVMFSGADMACACVQTYTTSNTRRHSYIPTAFTLEH